MTTALPHPLYPSLTRQMVDDGRREYARIYYSCNDGIRPDWEQVYANVQRRQAWELKMSAAQDREAS